MITSITALALAVSAFVGVLAYWPGPPDTPTDALPTYPATVYVVDTIGVKDRPAWREWNACGARIRLVAAPETVALDSPGTITIHGAYAEGDELPRGGWFEDHGVVFLPAGSWQRSIPVIRHEIGHALGFGHTKRWSIMGGSNHVQPIDCQGLRSYY